VISRPRRPCAGLPRRHSWAWGTNTWQVRATDLAYGWVAPPENFVGSTDLVAELRLADNKIADRQVLYLEWCTDRRTFPHNDGQLIPNAPKAARFTGRSQKEGGRASAPMAPLRVCRRRRKGGLAGGLIRQPIARCVRLEGSL